MKISLVIPAYNEEKYIGPCLESVQKYGTELFEVIVINNASTDKTAEIARTFPFARVIDEPKKGLPKARQRGLDEAKGDIVAFIDSDVQITKDWVSRIKIEFEKDQKLVCLSGPYIFYDTSVISKVFVWMYWTFLGRPMYFFTGYMAIGGNLVVKAESLRSVGGFDQSIEFYGDDTDIARRLYAVGHTKFAFNFNVYSSARRLQKEGVFITAYHYGINFLSIIFKGKPVTHTHGDIR